MVACSQNMFINAIRTSNKVKTFRFAHLKLSESIW